MEIGTNQKKSTRKVGKFEKLLDALSMRLFTKSLQNFVSYNQNTYCDANRATIHAVLIAKFTLAAC